MMESAGRPNLPAFTGWTARLSDFAQTITHMGEALQCGRARAEFMKLAVKKMAFSNLLEAICEIKREVRFA